MAEFINLSEDKFEGKTTYKNTKQLSLDGDFYPWALRVKINFRRIAIMPSTDDLLMDIYVESYKTDWPYLNGGHVVMLIDGESFTFEPNVNWHDCKTIEGNTTFMESCFYDISEDILKRIADSNTFAMKIYGENGSGEVKNVNAVVVYAKLFYNQVYDQSAYKDVVNNALEEFTRRDSDLSKFSKIATDGTGANGGCMGMLIALTTLFGSLLSCLCLIL